MSNAEHEALGEETLKYVEELIEQQIILGELDAVFDLAASQGEEEDRRSRSSSSSFDDTKGKRRQQETFWERYVLNIDMPRACLLILVVTILQTIVRHALFGQGRLATLQPEDPVPFFSDLSTFDHFTGNGANSENLLRNAEVSILMYYAPWSLHSMEMREIYSRVGERFRHFKGVRFSAVNCAANDGECKKNYKLFSYPIIVANVGRVAILYQDSPTEEHLFRWIYHMLHPATRVQSYDQFERILFEYDRCVVGYFDFQNVKPGALPPGYIAYIAAAMNLAQNGEQVENIQFAVVTNATLAAKLGITRSGAIRVFHIDNGVMFHEYPEKGEQKAQAIASWAITSKFNPSVVKWVSFAELELVGKSAKLHDTLNSADTSVVLMTSPRSKLFVGAAYTIFKQVAAEARDCSNDSESLLPDQADFWRNRTRDVQLRVKEIKMMCNRDKVPEEEAMKCCETITSENPNFCKGPCDEEAETCERTESSEIAICASISNATDYEGLVRQCCHKGRPRRLHQRAAWALSTSEKLLCEWAQITKWPAYQIFEDEDDTAYMDRCSANRTLQFVAMDRSNYLYTKLGLKNGEDAVLIVDSKQEAFYVLRKPLQSAAQLREFISLYDKNLLEPEVLTENRSVYSSRRSDELSSSRIEKLCSAADIEKNVLSRNVTYDSLVFFSGGSWHAPSTAVAHLMHALKHYFSAFDSLIKIFIIDSSRNTLPYELRFDRLPALVFFPSRRSAQSVKFPSGLPVTLPNLLSFVLSRCQSELRWRIALSACSDKCLLQGPHRLRRQISILKVEISLLRRLAMSPASENPEVLGQLVHQLIKRRTLQIRSARHLERLLLAIRSSKELVPEETDRFIKQTIFTQWVLYNAFGLKY
uniref:Thioredoxin domain-containing protein n=1 Tax=Steinernema glaseri TaxID=37863 RepID=A0A1I7YRB4_9BILA